MIGDMTYKEYAVNTFSHNGKTFQTLTPIHYVHPHNVSSYVRSDGTFVHGYWRDGDGNTKKDRMIGYYAKNPNAIPSLFEVRNKL